MGIFSFTKDPFNSILKKYFTFQNETVSLEPMAELLQSFRKTDFEAVVDFLKQHPEITTNFSYYIHRIFEGKPFNLSLTEADILSENAFFPELKKRFIDSILPAVENENTVWYIVDNVTVTPLSDLKYFRNVRPQLLDEFFSLLKIDDFIRKPGVKRDILLSMNILAWRVIGNAMDAEVMRMVPEYRNLDNPFIALQDELDMLNEEFRKDEKLELHSKDERYKQLKIYLQQCQDFVNKAFKNSRIYGISGKINQSLLKIRQQLTRMQDILALMVFDTPYDDVKNSRQLVFNILKYKSHKNNLGEFANESTRLLSHLITNHTAETGSHYITTGTRGYIKMFWKASGGGVIVGALCVLKMLYSYYPGSEFLHAVMYSFNYAMGFIMIYLMQYTLATKQPAMTAATMAKVLSEGQNTRKNYEEFALVVSKMFRSQFIAFIGNVIFAFPVALAIIYGLDVLLNQNLAIDKSATLLKDLDPFESKAIFHACIAGFYLFLSGIIAGNVGNNSVFYQIPLRIAKNPMINLLIGEKYAKALSRFYSRNWAGIMSNLWFGVFLGVTGPVGKFLGLDLDIRHITFAAGNFALGLYGMDFSVTAKVFWICLVTVFLIGFFNFIISFGLSMALALRSRRIDFSELMNIFREIYRFFMKNPLRFFVPIRSRLDSKVRETIDKTVSKK